MAVELSVTIVAYNNYQDIKNAIKTLQDKTSNNISKHIYIVDNGAVISNIKEKESFMKFLSYYQDVEYLDTGENLGFGRGHNYVLPYIDSNFHAIINPDIIFVEDSFSKIIDFLKANENIGMCIPDIRAEDGQRQLVYREEPTVFDMFIRMFCKNLFPKRIAKHTMQDKDYTKTFQVPFGQGSFLIIRTDLFKKMNGFDDNYFMYMEDADLCKRVNMESKVMYYPGTKVIHKWEQGSHKNKILFKYHLQSMKIYFDKWGWKII